MQERRVVNEAGLTQFFSRIYTLMGERAGRDGARQLFVRISIQS